MANLLSTTVNGNVLVGPSGTANAYDGAATGKLYFGNQVSDSPTHYHITTNMENFGGSYSKLDIRWYTGQRFYAHYAYGGFRFKEITTGNNLFSIGEGDVHVRVNNNLYIAGNLAIHAGNIGSQSVSYASSAGAVAWGNVSSKPGNIMYYQGFELNANTMDSNSTGFTYANNAPFYGPIARFSTGGGYDLWIGGAYNGGGNGFFLRTRNGDAGTLNAWREIITSGNIGSQSVSYATSAGSAGSATSAGYSDEAKWISYPDGPRDLSDRSPIWNNRSVAWDFVGAGTANGSGNYGGVMTFVPWDGTSASTGDSSYQLAFANTTGVNASGQPKLSIRNGINSTWNAWYTLIHSGNIGSQSVSYATSAGSASTAGSAGSVDGLTINNSGAPINPNNVTQNQIGYNDSVALFGQSDGGLYSSAHSSSWIHQIYGDFRTGQIAIRGKNANTWGDWRIVVDDRNIGSYAVPYGNMTSSTGLNDNKLYLRTNGDNNHYLWNAADDWEEMVYYNGTGFRVKGSTGTVSATFTDSGINLPSGSVAQFYTAAGSLRGHIQATDTDDNHFIIATSGGEDIVFKDGGLAGERNMVIRGNASVEAYGDFRAPIFYDSNDTGYYLDPNGTSNLLQLNTATRARWNMPRTWFDRSSRTSDQGYWTGTNGWAASDGTWANAWQGGFSGWDIWGEGIDHPQSGQGYVHAQGIVSGQHYATSSVGYGWMMVGAHNATANRYWLRGKWDTTTSGWVEMITTGNIGSQSVASATDASTLGGFGRGNTTNKVAYFDGTRNLYVNNPESYTGEVRLGAAWSRGGVYASGTLSLSTSGTQTHFVFNDSVPIIAYSTGQIDLGGSSNAPINVTGSAHKYITINPGNGYEAMVRYIGGSGSSWYVGKRTSAQLIGTESFHFYSEAAGATVGGINPSGDMIVTGSMRAPIFYDSADTNYYVDPNGVSRIYRLQVIGDWAGGNPNEGAINIRGNYPSMTFRNTISGNMWLRHMDGAGDIQHYFAPSGVDATNWSIKHTMFTDGTFFSSGSMRSPVFYDSQNTAYYLDPNNTGTSLNIAGGIVTTAPGGSVLLKHAVSEADAWIFQENAANWGLYWKNLSTGNHTFGGYTTIGAELFGMSAANASGNGVLTTNFVGATSAYAQYMLSNYTGYIWSASTIFAAGDMRAPIFYDSNDTNYYGNFASFSRMSEIGVTNNYVYNYDNIDSSRAVGEFGNVGKYVAKRSGAADYPSFSFEHTFGNHSWGQIARFHIGGSGGADRPSIQFSSAQSNSRWNIGFCTGTDDNFRISQNMGYRPDNSGTTDGWGTERFRINTDGTAYLPSTLYTNEISHANGRVSLTGNLHIDSYNGNDIYMNYYSARGTRIYVGSGTLALHVNTDGLVYMPTVVVNSHSDNTKGYRIHNTSGSSVSAMFTNSSNQLVIAAGAVDQINLNKKVYVNGVALGVNIAPSATAGRIDASNDIVAYSSSDERLKQNITPIANALDKVKSLTGVEFDWKPEHKEAHGHEGHDTGIIAQQVLGVMPTAVRTNDTGYLAVRYEKLIGLLIEANKELAARVEELEKKLG